MTNTAQSVDREGLKYLNSLAQWKGIGGFALSKIAPVLQVLGNPQDAFRSIHVAGTNGKGSVSVTLASILGASGYKVGLSSSPHIVKQNERIVIDGIAVTDEVLNRLSLQLKVASEECSIELTYFEAMTALSFMAFEEEKVDFGVIEVGLGGRLDATNVLKRPECCAIVSIDYDHQAILGDTLEQIAAEKAGIIKPGVRVVVGDMPNGPKEVIISVAAKLKSQLLAFGEDFLVNRVSNAQWRYSSRHSEFNFSLGLQGDHQACNAAVAIQLSELLGISNESISAGIQQVYWPARLEPVHYQGVPILLDSAHNPAGMRSFISFLDKQGLCNLTLGFGAITGKDWKSMIEGLKPYIANWYVMTPAYQDPIPSLEICDYLSGIGVNFSNFDTNYLGFLESLKESRVGDHNSPAVVVGSMYLIGIIRSFMDEPIRALWKRSSRHG